MAWPHSKLRALQIPFFIPSPAGSLRRSACPPTNITKLIDSGNSDVFSGIVWFCGTFGTGGYVDISRPVGGKMATYVVSDSVSGNVN